jgi:hypothetical protein
MNWLINNLFFKIISGYFQHRLDAKGIMGTDTGYLLELFGGSFQGISLKFMNLKSASLACAL